MSRYFNGELDGLNKINQNNSLSKALKYKVIYQSLFYMDDFSEKEILQKS